jgi:anti-sigma factor ChrR (cupin superfamily)
MTGERPRKKGSPHPNAQGDDLGTVLERWESFGGRWRVLARSDGSVTIALLSCDGGEQMGRVAGSSLDLAGYEASRSQGGP